MPTLPTLFHDAIASHLKRLEDRSLNARTPGAYPITHPTTRSIANYLNSLSTITLHRRQEVAGIIPSYYTINGPAPGTVVGIVLGSVAAFFLILWLLYSLMQTSGVGNGTIVAEEKVVVRKRPSRSNRSRRSTRVDVREELRDFSRSPRRSGGGGRSQIVVEERRGAPRRGSIVVESRVPGDDVVEVIEEHDEYRSRRGSRRNSGYR